MKCFLFFLLLGAFLLPTAAPAAKPNMIVVFIDDMGYSDLSCFGGHVETQHIDRLAAEGIRFTNFYVNSPICSPSRVALLTGQYPQRHRITSYLNNRRSNHRRGLAQWLDPKAPTLVRELQKSDYATGHFGKWHMGGQRDVDDAPAISAYGFDQSLTNFEGMGPKLLPLTLKPNPKGGDPIKGRIWADAERLGEGFQWRQRSEITTGFVEEALAFITQAQADQKPFYLNLWPDDVHGPWWPPLDKWGGSKRELYQGVLDSMDEQLARLFNRVRNDPALRENSVIVVCSDNGHEPGAGTSAPLRGAKTWMYEGGIRSPLIVWAPGLMPNAQWGTTNESSVFSALDLNRSLYALAGIGPVQELDGEDLSQTLIGKAKASRQAPLFWRRPPDRPGFSHGYKEDNPDLAVRDGRWKYLVNHDGSKPQLYDLRKDSSESRNLADQHPEIVARLDRALREWNAEMPVDASYPAFKVTTNVPATHFVNPIGPGQDPWVIRDPHEDRYLWCFSENDEGIALYESKSLTSFGKKHLIWEAPESGPYSKQVWAPELHWIDGAWHIYFAASDGENKNHRAFVLRSAGADPFGDYQLNGPLQTGDTDDQNLWAIDMTPFQHGDQLYAIWSGWDTPTSDRQFLYLAEMASSTKLADQRVLLCENDDYPWERTEPAPRGRGLNEGPQVLKHGDRTFVVYSCGASWLPSYKLGLLELTGEDPLDPASWKKFPEPIFQSTRDTFGVGHSCFVKSPDSSEWWHLFHAKRTRKPGWDRVIFGQPFRWSKDDLPLLGKPVKSGDRLPRPAGEKTTRHDLPEQSDFSFGQPDCAKRKSRHPVV